MVTARNDFEEFLLQQGFPPDRANYWASALERAAQSVTREDLVPLAHSISVEVMENDQTPAASEARQQQLLDMLSEKRREALTQQNADRRERRVISLLFLGGLAIAALRLYGVI